MTMQANCMRYRLLPEFGLDQVASMKRTFLLAVLVVVILQGCAASSIFRSYPDQLKPIKLQVDAKQFDKPKEDLNSHRTDADKILYLMERGRVAQLANDKKTSIEDFKLVMEEIAINDDKAKITATDTGAGAAALLLNDNAIPYKGDGYERIFLHHFQAMNYLFSKDPNAAMVEVRRANEEQTVAFQSHEDEVAKGEDKAREQAAKNPGFMNSFKSMADVAGRVKNSFQNAYTFYASGVIYEITGKTDDAYIDYKKALEISPDNVYLQKDVLRLAAALGRDSDLDHFKKSFTVTPEKPNPNDGSVVIFFEHDFAPVKMETKVPLALPNGISSVAFPMYLDQWRLETPLLIQNNGSLIGETKTIVNVQAMAAKALQEKLPGMMVRQVLRVIAKSETNKQSEKVGGMFAVGTQLFNLVTENADRRSWLTLPSDAQIYRGYVAPGEHDFHLTNGVAQTTLKVKVEPKKITVIRIVGTGATLHSDMVVM